MLGLNVVALVKRILWQLQDSLVKPSRGEKDTLRDRHLPLLRNAIWVTPQKRFSLAMGQKI